MELSTAKTKRTRHTGTGKTPKATNEDKYSKLAATAWGFAYSTLWGSYHFSTQETETAIGAIKAFIRLHPNAEKGFSVFCQRVALARTEFGKPLLVAMSLPSEWFDWRNDDGFVSTKPLFDRIEKTRASLPYHRQELKALAEAVLEFSQAPTKDNYRYWQEYFICHNQSVLLTLFRLAAVQHIYTA